MSVVARECRSTLAPPVFSSDTGDKILQAPLAVAVGEQDVFLPPRVLAPAAREKLGVQARVLPNAGHLTLEERPGEMVALVEELREEAMRKRL